MKRIVTFMLTLSLLVCLAVPSFAQDSNFNLSDWATDSYYKANQYGILNYFLRNEDFTVPITRAEFCDMVFNVVKNLDQAVTAEIDVCTPEPFSDTDRYSVFCLEQLGIAKGVGDGLFLPDGMLTREQAAAFMDRAGGILGFTYLPMETALFSDTSEISDWALDAVETMRKSGLMIGTETGAFLPRDLLTREQAAAVLVRFLELSGYNVGIYVRDEDRLLTLEDFIGLNGKYRSTGENTYEISFYQDTFASLVVNVADDVVIGALFTYLNTGESADLTLVHMDDFEPGMSYSGRYYLGGNAYDMEQDGWQMLELNGNIVLSLPADEYDRIGYQKMNGSYMAYAVKDGRTIFFSIPDGREQFTVDGNIFRITNKYILTEATRYTIPTVDAVYRIFGVYSLKGVEMEPLGSRLDELYQRAYIMDD